MFDGGNIGRLEEGRVYSVRRAGVGPLLALYLLLLRRLFCELTGRKRKVRRNISDSQM